MVSGARRDNDERDPALDRDRRHEGLGAVSAGHPEAVRSPRDGIACELLEVESVVEHDGLDAELVGQLDQTELRDLATAGPRVADEHRMTGTRDGMGPEGILRVQVPHHGQTRRADGHREEEQDQCGTDQRPVTVGRADHCRDDDDQTDDQGPQPDPASRRTLGDQPPPTSTSDRQADEHPEERGKVANREHDEDHHEHEPADDGQPGQRSLTSRRNRTLLRAHVCAPHDATSMPPFHFAFTLASSYRSRDSTTSRCTCPGIIRPRSNVSSFGAPASSCVLHDDGDGRSGE